MGTWVCPWSPNGVSIAAIPARATGVEVTYSQIGSRGEPWTSVKPSRSMRSGRAASQERVASAIVVRVHSIARRASTLKLSISRPPDGGRVVVAADAQRPDVPQPRDDLVRLRSVPHDVAQLPDLVHRRDGRQHCVEGREVGVDIGEDRDTHSGRVAERPWSERASAPLGRLTRVADVDRPVASGR